MDAPVITNIVDLLDSDGLTGVEPVFGGTTNVKTKFTENTRNLFSYVQNPSQLKVPEVPLPQSKYWQSQI